MKCLYCGKGIGPIRSLRDADFCSEEHRAQSSERYRRQLVEALAPEPAPARFADFIERPAAYGGPAPVAVLCALPKTLCGECLPAMRVEAAGVAVEQPDWVLGRTLASTPTRLAWHESATAFRPPVQSISFSITIQPPGRPAAGAALTRLVVGNRAARPATAARILASNQPLTYGSVSMPPAAQIPTPVKAAPASPQLQAAAPVLGDLAAIGPVPTAIHAAMVPPSNTTIARPAAPAGAQSAPQVSFAPATISSQPRPLAAGPMRGELQTALNNGLPVAFEPSGTRRIGVVLPTPPAAAASSPWIAAMQRARQAVQPAPRADVAMLPGVLAAKAGEPAILPASQLQAAKLAMAPLAQTAEPLPSEMPAASLSWHAERTDIIGKSTGPLGSHASPQVECAAVSSGALAGLVQPGTAPVHEADGNRNLRSVAASPAPMRTPDARPEVPALPAGQLAEMGSAPPLRAAAPTPAAPPAAEPSWAAARAVLENRPLVPLAELAVPRVDMPSPAGALEGLGKPLRADLRRAVRAYAVLWTLRSARLFDPFFRMDPIRVKFNDLLRHDRNLMFGQDLEDRPGKSKVLAFKRADARPGRPKWQYAMAAAAALLLAGVLRPQTGSKSFTASLPWHGMSIRQWMSQRATRSFADDFRDGLDQWKGMAKTASLSYNADGYVHPGQLALYRPSVPLSDYRFEFMAQIETKSVDWVVRAKDANNYYALKFTVLKGGPRPMVAMVHYPVIGGSQGSHVQTPLRMMIHANTPYRVTVDVKGNHYRTFVEDQEADVWTDDHLKTGGVGFFSESGERARVYWVKLESHGDILGRICGLLSGEGGSASANARGKEVQAMNYRHAGTDTKGTFGGGAEAVSGTAQEVRISRVLRREGRVDEGGAELVRVVDASEPRPPLFFTLAQMQYR